MRIALLAGCAGLTASAAAAQTSYVAPDGKNRFPAVTIFCPSGTGVAPCNFSGGGNAGGAVSLTLGGAPVSASNTLPVADTLLNSVIHNSLLSVGGTLAISALPPLPAGSNALGTIAVSNFPSLSAETLSIGGSAVSMTNKFPVTDPVIDQIVTGGLLSIGGTVSLAGTPSVAVTSLPPVSVAALPALPAGSNAIGTVAVSNFPATQTVTGGVAVSSLPALPAGSNAIGSVAVSNFPAVQPVSGTLAINALPALPAGTNALGSVAVTALPALPAGSNAIGAVSVSNFPATQSVTGTFWQTTQPVSAATLPLPAGAATSAAQTAPLAPVAPASATATNSVLLGCQAQTTLPSFTAGQQGAVPCDTSGHLYVVTVPSANNVPGYLQAVTSGGATPYSAVNAAASCMATNVKSSSGMVYSYSVSNSNTAGIWLRFFASGSAPSCGAGTPVKRIYVPAGTTLGLASALGWAFTGGIGFDVTSGSGSDTDTATIATANTVLVDIDYK